MMPHAQIGTHEPMRDYDGLAASIAP